MSESSPKLILLAGPNGAGKSTLAPFLLRDTLGIVEYVNADTLALGLSAFQPEGVAMSAYNWAGMIFLKMSSVAAIVEVLKTSSHTIGHWQRDGAYTIILCASRC